MNPIAPARFGSLIQIHLNKIQDLQQRSSLRQKLIDKYGHGPSRVLHAPIFVANTGHMTTRVMVTGKGPQPVDAYIQRQIMTMAKGVLNAKTVPADLVTIQSASGLGELPDPGGLHYAIRVPAQPGELGDVVYNLSPKTGKLSLVDHQGISNGVFSANPQGRWTCKA